MDKLEPETIKESEYDNEKFSTNTNGLLNIGQVSTGEQFGKNFIPIIKVVSGTLELKTDSTDPVYFTESTINHGLGTRNEVFGRYCDLDQFPNKDKWTMIQNIDNSASKGVIRMLVKGITKDDIILSIMLYTKPLQRIAYELYFTSVEL